MELIDKAEVLANIDKIQDTYISKLESRGMSHEDAVLFSAAYINGVKDAVEALEVKAKIEESEPTHFATSEKNEDIELYARNEADKFASKEYEYYNDIGLLKKGFYWGCKAGANWQEQQIKKSAIYGIVAGRVKDEVFVASRWFKDDKLKPAEDIKLIIIKK